MHNALVHTMLSSIVDLISIHFCMKRDLFIICQGRLYTTGGLSHTSKLKKNTTIFRTVKLKFNHIITITLSLHILYNLFLMVRGGFITCEILHNIINRQSIVKQ